LSNLFIKSSIFEVKNISFKLVFFIRDKYFCELLGYQVARCKEVAFGLVMNKSDLTQLLTPTTSLLRSTPLATLATFKFGEHKNESNSRKRFY
jgi:hypothetical protein